MKPTNHQFFSASHISYYHLCHRKLWLHHHGMRMEDNSTAVAEGILIGQTSYQRRPRKWRELALEGVRIDHFDPQTNTVKEVKKSPKLEVAHLAQVQYYLFRLEQVGVSHPKGVLEYPQQRKKREVALTDEDRKNVLGWLQEIENIVALPVCPPLVRKTYCRNCAFREFCFV